MCAAKLTQGRVKAMRRRRNWFRGMVCLVKKNYRENTLNVGSVHVLDLKKKKKYRACRPFHSCVLCRGQSLHDFLADAFEHGAQRCDDLPGGHHHPRTFAYRFIQSRRHKDPSGQSRG